MIKKIFNFLTKAGKTAKETVDKTTDFMDDMIEKETISNTIDKAKDLTGQVATKAGEVYQVTKQKTEELANSDTLKPYADKAKNLIDDISENENVKNISSKIKSTAENVLDKAEKALDTMEDKLEKKLFGEEEE